jgi:hypothetical protein
MGGNIARSAARLAPAAVRQVITLGSPLAMSRGAMPASVPLTAIYSRTDPIVPFPGALPTDPGARTIEVNGSHVGMAGNREVYRLLGRLLAEPAAAKQYL